MKIYEIFSRRFMPPRQSYEQNSSSREKVHVSNNRDEQTYDFGSNKTEKHLTFFRKTLNENCRNHKKTRTDPKKPQC